MFTYILNKIINYHYINQSPPYFLRAYVRTVILYGELLRQIGIIKMSEDEIYRYHRPHKIIVYTYGVLLFHESTSRGYLLYLVKSHFKERKFLKLTQLVSNSIYYFYDGYLLMKFFTSHPHLSAAHECIRGISQVIASLAYYFEKQDNGINPGIVDSKSFRTTVSKISRIFFCIEGFLLITKSLMKKEVSIIQTSLLAAGAIYSQCDMISHALRK